MSQRKNWFGILASICLGGALFAYGNQKLEEEARQKFSSEANDYVQQINVDFEKYSTVLRSLQALFTTNPNISHTDFRRYINSLDIGKNYPGFEALNYATYVEDKENAINKLKQELTVYLANNPALLEKSLQAVDKNSKEFGPNKEHFMINNIEPIEQSYDFIGKDIANNSRMYKALMEAKEKGYAKQSGSLFLSQDDKGRKFWAIGLRSPVYLSDKSYIGTVGVGINYGTVLNQALSKNKDMKYKAFDVRDGVKTLIFAPEHEKESFISGFNPAYNAIPAKSYSYEGSFLVNGKTFQITIYTENMKAYKSDMQLLIGLSILTVLAIIALWLAYFSLLTSKQHATSYADSVTRDLKHMAWFDSLTGLYNRAYSLTLMEERIKLFNDKPFLLFFIDLNGFKRVNDTLGHHAGDKVLREYANRLSEKFKEYKDIEIARVGGDEFILIVNGTENIEQWVDRISVVNQNPYWVENHKFNLSQSVGISQYPKDGEDSETLLRKSDMAMYVAKKSDGLVHFVYSDVLGIQLLEQTRMESDLLESINNNELYLQYQPKMTRQGNSYKITGLETLIRWNSAAWGEVKPDKFIPLAEANGFIDVISRWLIHEICKKLSLWKEQGIELPVSINVAGKQFLKVNLANQFLEIIDSYPISTQHIVLEITESTIMKDPETAYQVINMFRARGISLSMDDFGTGYSSFSYLSRFSLDELKIDKSFIRRVNQSNADRLVVEAIIVMAHKLNLKVVAEGVESQEEVDFLYSVGCDIIQGYFFSKPLHEPEFLEFAHTHM